MTTRTPTGRAIEVPHLVGVKADQATQRLRELGLTPITWSAKVNTSTTPASCSVLTHPPAARFAQGRITMSVATHPDFQGRADDVLASQADKLVQPPLTGPEICEHFAISPAERCDASAQLEEHGVPTEQSR
jgi:hypothetical protein